MMQAQVYCLHCVNFCTIINTVVVIIVIMINVSTLSLKTEDVSSLSLKTQDIGLHLHENTMIVLNCTYHKETNEYIVVRSIRWQKQKGRDFEDLVTFSAPGGLHPFIDKKMKMIYSNRTELVAPTNGSFSAIFIIKDVMCYDAGKYRCFLDYVFDSSNLEATSLSEVSFKVKATTPNYFRVFPNELEENQSLTLSCNADVGAPHGNIKIWKLAKDSNVPVLIFTSNTSVYETENCTEIINATFTYTVSRDDNGAVFRCSSQNVLEPEAEQSLESQRISVIYAPYETMIWLTPNMSSFYVGDDVQLHCKTDSNPTSNFTWSFLSSNNSREMVKNVLPDNTELILKNIQLNNSGDYMCTVNNGKGTDHKVVSISVRKPLKRNRTKFSCDQCGHSEICLKENGAAHCVTNVWMPIAIIFIILCPIFVGIIIYLIKQKISLKNQQTPNNNCLQSQSVDHPSHPSTSIEYSLAFSGEPCDSPNHPSEAEILLSGSACGSQTVCPIPYDHDAGYSTHQDLIGMQEQCTMLPDEHDDPTANQENMMLPNPNEHDDPTASQEKVQYAEVSKKQRTENVYDSPWIQLI